MSWMLIALVLLVAFGPILWLVPSRRDKRLSALRARARSEGLMVEIRRIPKPDPAPEDRVSAGGRIREPVIACAAYGLALQSKLRYLPTWRLVREAPPGEPDPLPDWQYDLRPEGSGRAYLKPLLGLVSGVLARLPDDVLAFELEAGRVLVYWLEKPGATVETVSRIAGILRSFEQDLRALEADIESSREGNDS